MDNYTGWGKLYQIPYVHICIKSPPRQIISNLPQGKLYQITPKANYLKSPMSKCIISPQGKLYQISAKANYIKSPMAIYLRNPQWPYIYQIPHGPSYSKLPWPYLYIKSPRQSNSPIAIYLYPILNGHIYINSPINIYQNLQLPYFYQIPHGHISIKSPMAIKRSNPQGILYKIPHCHIYQNPNGHIYIKSPKANYIKSPKAIYLSNLQ